MRDLKWIEPEDADKRWDNNHGQEGPNQVEKGCPKDPSFWVKGQQEESDPAHVTIGVVLEIWATLDNVVRYVAGCDIRDVMLWPERRVVGDDGKDDHAQGHHDEDQIQTHHHL